MIFESPLPDRRPLYSFRETKREFILYDQRQNVPSSLSIMLAFLFVILIHVLDDIILLCLVEDNDLRAIWDIVMGEHTQIILQKDLVLNTHHTRHIHTQKHT